MWVLVMMAMLTDLNECHLFKAQSGKADITKNAVDPVFNLKTI